MTYAPKTIAAFAKVWTDHGGVNSGIVGDTRHTGGYHLGRDRLFSSTGKGWADYSVQLQRDKNGLSDAAAAFDFGKLNGSLSKLQHFSRWLVEKCKADPAARYLVREFIYTPNGQTPIHRYSGPDNKVYTGSGSGDTSHLWHSHLSFYRDTEYKDKTWLLNEYFAQFATPPDTSTGDTVQKFAVPKVPQEVFVATGTWLYDNSGLATSTENIKIDPGRWMPYHGLVDGARIVAYVNASGEASGVAYFVKADAVSKFRNVSTGVDDGITQATVDAAVAAEKAACAPKVALAQQTGYNEGVATEKSRIRKLLGV